MDPDRNLLFAALALQTGLIDPQQFAEARKLWEARPQEPLEDTLRERGWISDSDQPHVEYLVQRTLEKHRGDARQSLTALSCVVRDSLAPLQEFDTECTAISVMPHPSDGLPSTAAGHPCPEERYDFLRLHATGGIGQVWLARDRHLDREVALKQLLPGRAGISRVASRFVREARLTGQLEHPGIVPVYELTGPTDTRGPCYTMRFVRGKTLTEVVDAYHAKRARGAADPLDFVALLTAFVTVCNTIAYAHSRGVLHRDLKGANVILGDFGEVIVLDWGLAKHVGTQDEEEPFELSLDLAPDRTDNATLTFEGEVIGTPAYMAPEQAEGCLDQIDQRTDIYGLGAILYEILTGRPPFVGANSADVLRKAAEGNPPPPRHLCPDVPPSLEAVCLKALAKDPAARHASAADLGHEVQRWQDEQRRQAEEALRASEAQYRSLADLIPGVVWTARPDGWIDYANQFWFDYTGLTMEQTEGTGWAAAVHPEDIARVTQLWTKALESGEPIEVDYRLKRAADGVYRWFLAQSRPVRDRDGRVVKWFGMLTEIGTRLR